MQKDQVKIRVAIYTRGSTESQIERDSLPFQKNSLEKYAVHALNADSYEVFTDAGFTAPTYEDRIICVSCRKYGAESSRICSYGESTVSAEI